MDSASLTGLSKWKGDKSEISVAYKLMMMDLSVSQPFGDNQPYDLILDIDSKLYKVQVKTGRLSDDDKYITAHLSKSIIGEGKKYKRSLYASEQVDLFAVHCLETNETCLIPFEQVEDQGMVTIRRKESRQMNNCKLLDDLLIDTVIEKLRNGEKVKTRSAKKKKIEFEELPKELRYARRRVGNSGFRGVQNSTKKSTKWESYLCHGKNIKIFVGRSDDARELAKMYDQKALEILQDRAITNAMLGLL